MVERTYGGGAVIPGAASVDENTEFGVTWLHSYVASAAHQTFCICDAPSPEAIRRAAKRSSLSVERITQVSVLDPYVFREPLDKGES